MFPALLEKLNRRHDLTSDEAAGAMTETHRRPRGAGAHCRPVDRLRMKGERPEEIVGLARTMRAHAVKLSKAYEDLFDTCGTGETARTASMCRRSPPWSSRRAGTRGQAWEPLGLEPVRQR